MSSRQPLGPDWRRIGMRGRPCCIAITPARRMCMSSPRGWILKQVEASTSRHLVGKTPTMHCAIGKTTNTGGHDRMIRRGAVWSSLVTVRLGCARRSRLKKKIRVLC